MDSDQSAVVPTEDVVDCLIEFLVDPLLPARPSLRDAPSISLQQSVAKQLHAVVLLYNYYHRKQFPHLEFLDFESFCKVAINSKPNLLVHMKHMQRCISQPDIFDEQFSITEKAVIDACNICLGLDASKDAPSLEEWPISKVVVFLADTMEKNCLLLMSDITQGVWSPIEKNCHDYNFRSEGTFVKKSANKRSGDELSADHLWKLALLAVEEKTGISQTDILLLESHVVYSLSEEKMAACFYIAKFNESINHDIIQIPINDAINSLLGPLVKKSFSICSVTPVVEYFHLLPCAGIIAQWYSRKMFLNDSQLKLEGETDVNMDFPPRNDESCTKAPAENIDRSHAMCQSATVVDIITSNNITEKVNNNETSSDCIGDFSNANCGPHNKAKAGSSIVSSPRDEMACSPENDSTNTSTCFLYKAEVVDLVREPCNDDSTNVNAVDLSYMGCNELIQDGKITRDHPPVPSQSNSQNVGTIKAMMIPKGNGLSQTVLKVLLNKRSKLSNQLRHQVDELARFEKNLQAIFSGGEDNLMLMIESVIEAYNMSCTEGGAETQMEKHLPFQEQHSPQRFKKRKLFDATLHLSNTCQELDNICCENNWMLPQYNVFPCNGGFSANVTVRGVDFECSDCGDLRANPREGMESAASHILKKLGSMASQAQ